MKNIQILLLFWGMITISSCSNKSRSGEATDPVVSDSISNTLGCDEAFDNLDPEMPILIVDSLNDSHNKAYFIVRSQNPGELMFWGFNVGENAEGQPDSLIIGAGNSEADLMTSGFEDIQPLTQWAGSDDLFYQVVNVIHPGLEDLRYIEVQVYYGTSKKGKGTLVSQRPIHPEPLQPEQADGSTAEGEL